VRLSVRTDVNNPATQIGSTDLMEHVVTPGTSNFGAARLATCGKRCSPTLSTRQHRHVREVLTPAAGLLTGSIDPAFSRSVQRWRSRNYTIDTNADGGVTISDAAVPPSMALTRCGTWSGQASARLMQSPACAHTHTSRSLDLHLWPVRRQPR
jgi:hypothetical protein